VIRPLSMPSGLPNTAWVGPRFASATQPPPTAGPGWWPRSSGSSGWPGQWWRINACPGSARSPRNASAPVASAAPSVDFCPPWALRPRQPNPAESPRPPSRPTSRTRRALCSRSSPPPQGGV